MTIPNENLTGFRSAIEKLRQFDSGMPLICVEMLLLIAREPGVSQVDAMSKMGSNKATTSRIVADLLMIRHGLVRQVEDSDDRRIRRNYLTAKGERFVAELSAALGA